MTNLALAAIAIGLVIGRSVAQLKGQEMGCKEGVEYPSGVSIGPYGEVKFHCAKEECQSHRPPACNRVYYELKCNSTSWVGGVADSSNVNNLVPLMCCNVPELKFGKPQQAKVIPAGGSFYGRQTRDNYGNLVFFEVIKQISKVQLGRNNEYGLEIETVKMSCKSKAARAGSAQYQLSVDGAVQPDVFGQPGQVFQPPFGGGRGRGRGRGRDRDNRGRGRGRGEQEFGGDDFGGDQVQAQIYEVEGDPFGSPDLGPIEPQLPFEQGPIDPFAGLQPAAPAAPAAAAAPLGAAGGFGGGAGFCFTSDTTVETPSGTKTMDELKIGDQVLSMQEGIQKFSKVTSFLHRLPEADVRFREIVAEDGTSVKLTEQHFIYTANCKDTGKAKMKFAGDVKAGECLIKVDSELHTTSRIPVVSNKEINQVGAYAPLTENGVIVTNGLMASCHSVFKNDEFMDSFTFYADKVKGLFSGLLNVEQGNVKLPWLMEWGRHQLQNLVLVNEK